MIRRSFDWDSDNFVIARIGHHCFYGENDDGGQSSAGMDGGSQDGGGNPADAAQGNSTGASQGNTEDAGQGHPDWGGNGVANQHAAPSGVESDTQGAALGIDSQGNVSESVDYGYYDPSPNRVNLGHTWGERARDKYGARTTVDQRSLTEGEVNRAIRSFQTIKSYTERQKAIKEWKEKNKVGLRHLSVQNAKKEYGMGMFGTPMMGLLGLTRNVMHGLLDKLGFTVGIDTPAMDALNRAARQAGVDDKETGEYSEVEAMEVCNSLQGYQWNPTNKTCEKVSSGGV